MRSGRCSHSPNTIPLVRPALYGYRPTMDALLALVLTVGFVFVTAKACERYGVARVLGGLFLVLTAASVLGL